MSMLIEVWGDYACFSRPEMKTERVSYDIMTPSAARGLVEAIYWHPGMKYHIDRIYLLKPVQFASIRRNEVKDTLRSSAALSAAKGGGAHAVHGREYPAAGGAGAAGCALRDRMPFYHDRKSRTRR